MAKRFKIFSPLNIIISFSGYLEKDNHNLLEDCQVSSTDEILTLTPVYSTTDDE